jgi:hypothetical protein
MGSGAFGSNGSVHWEVRYSNAANAKADHRDIDDSRRHPGDRNRTRRALPLIGGRTKQKFRVIARYPTRDAAIQALKRALSTTQHSKRNKPVVLNVDLRSYRKNPGNPDRWEVKVDW